LNSSYYDKEIAQYELGILSFDGTIKLFQKLVDSGDLVHMKSEYYIQANSLIDFGHIIRK